MYSLSLLNCFEAHKPEIPVFWLKIYCIAFWITPVKKIFQNKNQADTVVVRVEYYNKIRFKV